MINQLRNIFENTYYNISDIDCVIYDRKMQSTTIVFAKAINGYEALSFREEFNSLRIDYYKSLGVLSYTDRLKCDNFIYGENLFDAFSLLPYIEDNAIITIGGNVYQDKNLMNFYSSDAIHRLQQIQR